VPNLLPDTSKVLPDYFKGNIYKPTKKNILVAIIMWFSGILVFLFALANLNHFLLFLLLAFLGFMLIPLGHRFIEKKLRFRLAQDQDGCCIRIIFRISSSFQSLQ
jgi:hypothetical protein